MRAATRRGLEVALVVGLLGLVTFCALRPIWDIDIFWHVAVGRWIADNLSLPDRDLWSAADPDAPWRSFQWLYQGLVAVVDRAGGLTAVRAVHAAWVVGTFGLAWALLRRRGLGVAATLALVLLLLVDWHDRMRVRPHVINLTAWLLIAAAVDRAARGVLRPAIALPVTVVGFLLWSALHLGGAFIAVALLAGLSVATLVLARWRGRTPYDLHVHGLALAALVGWLLCPGAADSLEYAAGQHGGSIEVIPEWRSWWEVLRSFGEVAHANMALTLASLPVAAALCGLGWFRWLRAARVGDESLAVQRPLGLVLALPLLALGFLWIRFTWMAWLAGLLAASWLWGRGAPLRVPRAALAAASVVLLAVTVHYTTLAQYPSFGAAVEARTLDVDPRIFPADVTALLVRSGLEGRVGVPSAWGGYVLYYGWPALRVTSDGRKVAPPKVLTLTEAIARSWGRPDAAAALPALYGALPADFLIMPHPAFRTRDTGEWLPVASSRLADLYVRRGSASAERVARIGAAHPP